MRTIFYAVAFLAMVLLALVGCSDRSVSPVSPTDQSINQPGSLEKNIIREFSGTAYPIEVTDPGTTKEVDGKTIIKGMRTKIIFNATFTDGGADLLSGEGDLELNGIVDFAAGTTFWWGKLKLTPAAPEALGGHWELIWHGRGTLGSAGWTIPLKESGYGKGGSLNGLHAFFDHIITAPPDISTWTGSAEGFIKSRCGHH